MSTDWLLGFCNFHLKKGIVNNLILLMWQVGKRLACSLGFLMEHRYAGHKAAREQLPAFQLMWTQTDLLLPLLLLPLLLLLLLLLHLPGAAAGAGSGWGLQLVWSAATSKGRSAQLYSSVRHSSTTPRAFSKQTVWGRFVLNQTQKPEISSSILSFARKPQLLRITSKAKKKLYLVPKLHWPFKTTSSSSLKMSKLL